jgi:hypothetical protein
MNIENGLLKFWRQLDARLSERGEAIACFGDARIWYQCGFSPAEAAQIIADERAYFIALGAAENMTRH